MMQSKLRKNTLQSLFDTHCEVVRTTAVADEFGTTSESQAIVAKYPCRITLYAEGGKGEEPLIGDQTVARTLWRIYLPVIAKIDVTDTLKIGAESYTVLETTSGRSDASILCVFARRDR